MVLMSSSFHCSTLLWKIIQNGVEDGLGTLPDFFFPIRFLQSLTWMKFLILYELCRKPQSSRNQTICHLFLSHAEYQLGTLYLGNREPITGTIPWNSQL